jgi:hypothetical protein
VRETWHRRHDRGWSVCRGLVYGWRHGRVIAGSFRARLRLKPSSSSCCKCARFGACFPCSAPTYQPHFAHTSATFRIHEAHTVCRKAGVQEYTRTW